MTQPFEPKPGQIDFTNARWTPVINCVLKYRDTLLVVQRSKEINFYPGYWNGISGFLDDHKSLKEKVIEELSEELGIDESKIVSYKFGDIFDKDEPTYNKTWIVHPVLVEVSTNEITLDWEANTYAWLHFDEIRKLELLPGFETVLDNISSLL